MHISTTENKITAIFLLAVSVLAIILMIFHPTLTAHTALQQVAELNHKATINQSVHGILIGCILVFCHALSLFTLQIRNALSIAALLLFIFGSLAMIIAALLSGFIFPGYVMGLANIEQDTFYSAKNLFWVANQTFAYAGSYAFCAATLLWGCSLINEKNQSNIFAFSALLIGLVPLLCLIFEIIKLDVMGMTFIVICQTIWYLIAALILLKMRPK